MPTGKKKPKTGLLVKDKAQDHIGNFRYYAKLSSNALKELSSGIESGPLKRAVKKLITELKLEEEIERLQKIFEAEPASTFHVPEKTHKRKM